MEVPYLRSLVFGAFRELGRDVSWSEWPAQPSLAFRLFSHPDIEAPPAIKNPEVWYLESLQTRD